MHAVAFAAGKLSDFLLLIAALEVEGRAVAARIHLALAEQDDVLAVGDFLPDALLAVERVARLVDITKMHRLADLDRACIRLLLPGDHAEQRGLAGAIRPDNADNAAWRQPECEVIDQKVAAESLSKMIEVDDVLTEPFRHGNRDLRDAVGLGVGDLEQFLVALVARLRFGLPRLRRGRNPLLLALKRAPPRLTLAAFLLEPLLLLPQPGRIISFVGNAAAVVEFQNPAGDVVEKVAVVGDDQDRARIIAQMAFEPMDRLGVEMVGRLVEQQQFGLFEQQPAQRDTAALATRKLF